ncbi:hypothetical protein HQ563_07595 [bacterium]|nr:hypothetical protein [bacterium]
MKRFCLLLVVVLMYGCGREKPTEPEAYVAVDVVSSQCDISLGGRELKGVAWTEVFGVSAGKHKLRAKLTRKPEVTAEMTFTIAKGETRDYRVFSQPAGTAEAGGTPPEAKTLRIEKMESESFQ